VAASDVGAGGVAAGDGTDDGRGRRCAQRLRWRPRPYDAVGLAVALLLAWLSLIPTLLPPSWQFQGVVTGLAAAIGYGLGSVGTHVVSWMLERPVRWRPRRTARSTQALLLAAALVTLLDLVGYVGWQRQLRDLMGMEDISAAWNPLGVAVLATLVFVGVVGVARLLGRGVALVVRALNRVAPPRVSVVVGTTLVLLLLVGVLNGVVGRVVHGSLDASFKAVNSETHADSPAPRPPELSGSTASLVTWDSLGRTGREFVSQAATPAELEAFSGRPAEQPIRAYVGLDSVDDLSEAAALAVRELERTGAFSRSVLAVITTTGTGWVNENGADAIEYLTNGDSAIVSLQYSYLPSWMAFITDRDRAREAGRQLFNAVYERWRELPRGERPRLVVGGESLGSFGGEAAFSGVDDLRNRTDGALFVGPPFMNELWRDLTDHRDEGSPEWLPTYQHGRTVRFMARPSDLERPTPEWTGTRVVYLQYASDPITWWSPDLLFSRPDWLREKRGYDVLPSTRWVPIVTFLQVTADLVVGHSPPAGHGHQFGEDPADAWAVILHPDGWTDADTARLREVLVERTAQRNG
jgi:uncharacterized membrane protein